MAEQFKYSEELKADDIRRRLRRMVSDRQLVEGIVDRAIRNAMKISRGGDSNERKDLRRPD